MKVLIHIDHPLSLEVSMLRAVAEEASVAPEIAFVRCRPVASVSLMILHNSVCTSAADGGVKCSSNPRIRQLSRYQAGLRMHHTQARTYADTYWLPRSCGQKIDLLTVAEYVIASLDFRSLLQTPTRSRKWYHAECCSCP